MGTNMSQLKLVSVLSAFLRQAHRSAKSSVLNTEPTMSKPRIQSRTNLFGLGLVAFGFLADNMATLQAAMSPKAFSIFSIIVGLAVILLREVTTGPVGRRR